MNIGVGIGIGIELDNWGEPERAPHKREVRAACLSVCLSFCLSVRS